ncbi:MAG: phosphatidylinositol mannoside acyltransferase [Streptosporangiaceae bacterium]
MREREEGRDRRGRAKVWLLATALTLGWAVVRWVPEPVARGGFRLIAAAIWRRQGRGVRQLEANLRRVVASPESELPRLTRAAVRSYLRYWMEVFRLSVMDHDRLLSEFHVRDVERLWSTLRLGGGVILALPHMGNWEHAGAWVAASGYPFTTVAERLRPESLFDRFVAFRESLGMEVLPLTGGNGHVFETLARRLRSGRLVCLLSDRDLTSTGVEVKFFSEAARMPAGPAALALETGAALLPVTLWYEGEHWAARIHEEVEAPREGSREEKVAAMTQTLALAFEEGIAAHPCDWHMLQRLWVADVDSARLPEPEARSRSVRG